MRIIQIAAYIIAAFFCVALFGRHAERTMNRLFPNNLSR